MLTYAGLFGRAARLPGRAIGHKTARARSRLAEAAARQNPVPMQPAVRGIAHQDGSVPENTFEIFALALLPPDGFPAKHVPSLYDIQHTNSSLTHLILGY